MAKQTIGIGSAANDGTGDPLRTAFSKVNDNFNEVYSSFDMTGKLSVGNSTVNSSMSNTSGFRAGNSTFIATVNSVAIQISNVSAVSTLTATSLSVGANVIANLTTVAIGNSTVYFAANNSTVRVANSTYSSNLTPAGLIVGNNAVNSSAITVGANVIINTTAIYVGNSVSNVVITPAGLTGNVSFNNVTISGNLVVNGAVTTVNTSTLDVADINITIAKNAPDAATANGAGININGANASIQYISDSNNIVISHSIEIGNSAANAVINSTTFTGTANNANYLNGTAAASYVKTSGAYTISGNLTFTGNSIFNGKVNANTVNVTSITFGNSSFTSVLNSYAMVFGPYDSAANATLINTGMVYVLNYKTGGNVSFGQLTNYSLDIRETGGGRTQKVYLDQSTASLTMSMNENILDPNDYASKLFVNTSTISVGTNTVYSTINSTTFSGTANNTSYVGTVSAANVVSNAQLSANLGNYQTTADLSANVAKLTANNTSFVGTVSAANVVSNAQLSANLGNYQTTAGLATNVATLTANNSTNLGGVPAASYVNTSGNYTVAGNLNFTAANNVFAANTVKIGTSTLAANGYTYLPNGLKMNWGVVAANSSTAGAVTWNSAFTTAVYSVQATAANNLGAGTYTPAVISFTTTTANIATSNTNSVNVYFVAIGI